LVRVSFFESAASKQEKLVKELCEPSPNQKSESLNGLFASSPELLKRKLAKARRSRLSPLRLFHGVQLLSADDGHGLAELSVAAGARNRPKRSDGCRRLREGG